MPRVCRKTERKDYSDLLRELQGKPAAEEEPEAGPVKKVEAKSVERKPAVNDEKRNRLMSNEDNRFVYVPKWNTIHDKSCPSVKRIATEDLEFKHDLVPGAKQCPVCELRRCLRIGARDGMRVKQYQDYFESLGLTKEVYHRLYIQLGAQTRLMNDTLIVWYKDDAWKIERVHIDNRVILWHNNYYVDKNYARLFYGGFHKQLPEGVTVSFKTALKHIEGYAPTVHIVEKKIKKIQPQIDTAREYFKRWMALRWLEIAKSQMCILKNSAGISGGVLTGTSSSMLGNWIMKSRSYLQCLAYLERRLVLRA